MLRQITVNDVNWFYRYTDEVIATQGTMPKYAAGTSIVKHKALPNKTLQPAINKQPVAAQNHYPS